jgi:hypothetical protein
MWSIISIAQVPKKAANCLASGLVATAAAAAAALAAALAAAAAAVWGVS